MNRHFILTNGRSGSNFFVQALNQNPQVVNYGEVLGDWTMAGRRLRDRFSTSADYLDWLMNSPIAFYGGQAGSAFARKRAGKRTHFRRRGGVATIGVKEFVVNLRRYGLDKYLEDRKDISLVTLIRENVVERYVSTKLLEKTGQIARVSVEGAAVQARLTIDPATIVGDLDVIDAENEAVRRAEARHKGPVFPLRYEDYFGASAEERDEVTNALQSFLGVEPKPLATEHRKLRRASLPDVIENYEAFAATLKGTKYEACLQEASG